MNLSSAIKEELLSDLPGRKAQEIMAPEHPRTFPPSHLVKQNAAVSLIILAGNDKTDIILTKRAEYNGHHSGQISFPGGKEEESDKSHIETAIRETKEEIGLNLSKENCLGSLTPLYIMVSDFMVFPFVFFYDYNNKIEFILDKQEVEYIIQFNLLSLLDKSLVKTTKLTLEDSSVILTPYYGINNEMVWGATAMILSEFIEVLYRVEKKNLPDLTC